RPLDRLGVGVDEELARVEAVPVGRVVGAVDTVAVALAGVDARQVAVPDVGRPLDDRDLLLVALAVEQAERDLGRVLGEQREVRAVAVPGRAERERAAGPDLARALGVRRRGHRTSAPARAGRSTRPFATRVPSW